MSNINKINNVIINNVKAQHNTITFDKVEIGDFCYVPDLDMLCLKISASDAFVWNESDRGVNEIDSDMKVYKTKTEINWRYVATNE